MNDRDFSAFDQIVDKIILSLSDEDRESVKRRINFELDQIESQSGSLVYEMFTATRERILAIERKALARLGERTTQPTEQGRRCSLCAHYESDVLLVPLGKAHAICRECVLLVKEIVDEDKNAPRSDE